MTLDRRDPNPTREQVLFEDAELQVIKDHGTATIHTLGPLTRRSPDAVIGHLATLLAARGNKKGIKDDRHKPHLSILPSHAVRALLQQEPESMQGEHCIATGNLAAAASDLCDVMDEDCHEIQSIEVAYDRLHIVCRTLQVASKLSMPAFLAEAASVMMHGAKKYAVNNWRKLRPSRRYADAALRHLFAVIGGEEKDNETNLLHLSHAMCCVVFLMHHAKNVELEELRAHHEYGLPTQAQLVAS